MARNTIDSIEREMDRLRQKKDQLEYFGADEFLDGAVLQFDKAFGNGGTIYSYVAIKAAGLWYLSGRLQVGVSWEELVDFMSKGVDKVWVVKEYEEI